jgi:transcriptional regulator with XRE-family HTH domain
MYNIYMNSKRLGSYLKEKRLENGLSRQSLAALLNVSFGHINNIERGDRMPSASLMMAFAKQFNITTGYLYSLIEDESTSKEQDTEPDNKVNDLDEPEYLVFLSADPNLPESERKLMAGIIRRRYAEAKRNREELNKIPPGINRPSITENPG